MTTSRLSQTLAAIDAANANDPRKVETERGPLPFELVYAERMSATLAQVYPEASELLQIAARAQHLRRWEIRRGDYAEGRQGYNDWRKTCRAHHAKLAAEIMGAQGYAQDEIVRVGMLIRKEQLKKDRESQALENVVAIVFVQHYFDAFLAKYDGYEDAKIVDILGKTLCKMSPRGHAAALQLPLAPRAQRLVGAAIAKEAAALERLAKVSID
jgi:hypothetical protein